MVNESYVKLGDSRGIESDQHKLFMRMSALISDIVVFFPSVVLIIKKLVVGDTDYMAALFLALINPTLTLIDHGHFQYNAVSLGLMQLALYYILCLDTNRRHSRRLLIFTSVSFSLALNYKQMELYHALPFFCFLLGSCVFKSASLINGVYKLATIGSSVIITFLVVWLPFVLNGTQSVLDVLKRLFPFDRGLYEDKVANIWCSVSPVYKLKELYSIPVLSRLCALTTLIMVAPSSFDLFMRPSRQRFHVALINSALVFFLFSYHVHEKSILLATVPACLLINFYPSLITWFIYIANFSMLPLLHKDGLLTAYLSTTSIFVCVAYFYYNLNQFRQIDFWPKFKFKSLETIFKISFYGSIVGSGMLTLGFLLVKPSAGLPDLWPLLISIYSFAHFVGFLLVFHWIQFTLKSDDLASIDFASQLSNHAAKSKQKKL